MAWEQPKTIKLYLSAPESRRLVTVWPDFKAVSKKIEDPREGEKPRDFGIRFLFGNTAQPPDWHKTSFTIRKDGIPIHTMHTKHQDFYVSLESFCTWEEEPATYLQIEITNKGLTENLLLLGVMPRTGSDSLLFGIAGDFYASYQPLLEHWDMLKNTWVRKEDSLRDGDKRISFRSEKTLSSKWVTQNKTNRFAKNYLEIRIPLGCRETTRLCFLMDKQGRMLGSAKEYGLERTGVIARWQAELKKVNVKPRVPAPEFAAVFNSLVCQSLQMFAVGDDNLVRPRQGGRYSGVWPTEAFEYLMALDRIGLSEWAKKGYDYFRHYQVSEGEDRGRYLSVQSPAWMNHTGAVLYGLAYHLTLQGRLEYFQAWRPSILTAIDWITRQRTKTRTDPEALGYGLMPAGIGHDWGWTGQYWCATDGLIFMGLRATAKIFSLFNDPLAGKLQEEAEDYRQCLTKVLQKLSEPQNDRKELFLTNMLGAEEQYPPIGPYFGDGPINLIRAGIIDSRSEIFEKIEAYFFNRGWMQNGLNGLMTCGHLGSWMSEPWAGHTWYTSYSDFSWFSAWLARGEREKAERTLRAQIKYSMTPEFYMQERYADNDPTFCPWQPNASANGRTIMMLLDFFGEEKNQAVCKG